MDYLPPLRPPPERPPPDDLPPPPDLIAPPEDLPPLLLRIEPLLLEEDRELLTDDDRLELLLGADILDELLLLELTVLRLAFPRRFIVAPRFDLRTFELNRSLELERLTAFEFLLETLLALRLDIVLPLTLEFRVERLP